MAKESKNQLLSLIRLGREMTLRQQLHLMALLSTPAIMAHISSTLMQYIDAAMVGHLGARATASIGLVESTIWLFAGICSAVATGFYVQVAHHIGANRFIEARNVLRQSLVAVLAFSFCVLLGGVIISESLPFWLGGSEDIAPYSSAYFRIFALCIPFLQLEMLAGGMLRCSGNLLVPSMLNILMCILDVIFNFFLIYPTRICELGDVHLWIPGAGLGVIGAALGTAGAEIVVAALMLYFLCVRSNEMKIVDEAGRRFMPTRKCVLKAIKIGVPMGIQCMVTSTAQIVTTLIIAPLGTVALAAHSLGISVESLCYMPGYGISEAATTLVGQSMGARRPSLMKRFAYISVAMGMSVMTVMGIIMYVFAPLMMGILTPDLEVQHLGAMCLRIEAMAEPMFAIAIVCYGCFVGAGDTLVPSGMNFVSMWAVRLTIAAILAPTYGLKGVWIAMCVELCFRGAIFLARMRWGHWAKTLPAET